jgi:hypothetical protein
MQHPTFANYECKQENRDNTDEPWITGFNRGEGCKKLPERIPDG